MRLPVCTDAFTFSPHTARIVTQTLHRTQASLTVEVTAAAHHTTTTTTTTVLRPLFRDHPGEPVPEENFWTLWCKGRLTEADTLTIRLGATPCGLTSAYLHHPPYFLQARCPSCHPTNSVKALKATNAFGFRTRRKSSPQRCYLHRLRTLVHPNCKC